MDSQPKPMRMKKLFTKTNFLLGSVEFGKIYFLVLFDYIESETSLFNFLDIILSQAKSIRVKILILLYATRNERLWPKR